MSRSRKRRRIDPIVIGLAMLFLASLILQNACAAPIFADATIPSTADAGQTIPVFVNVTSGSSEVEVFITYQNPANGSYNYVMMTGNASLGTWSYDIPAQPWKGTLEVMITAKDGSGTTQYPASGFATIEITGEAQPKPFPWNMAFMIIFLGVVLVLTELIFKPGFYRKTGREKARELEEQDRAKLAEEENGPGEAPDSQGSITEKPM